MTMEMEYISAYLPVNMLSLITPAVLILIIYKLWYIYNVSTRDHSCKTPLPPGGMGIPIVGETLQYILKADFSKHRIKQMGSKVFKTHLLGRPTIRVVGAENVRKILSGEHDIVTSQWPASFRKIMGDGCLAHSTGEIHRQRRRVIMRAFTHDALCSYVNPLQEVIRTYIFKWCQKSLVFGYPECQDMTFAATAKVLLGFDLNAMEKLELNSVFNIMVGNMFSLPISIPGSGLYKGLRARDILLRTIGEKIDHRRLHGSATEHEDALSLLLEEIEKGEDNMTERELKDSVLEMMFAGHSTTSSAACSVIMLLGSHPHVMERVSAELRSHDLMHSGDGTDLSYDAINKLKYVNQVVKEVLRVAPPAGGGFRKALKTFEINGMQVPKDWTIAYSIRDTHQLSTYFDDGDKFDPGRWEEDNRLPGTQADSHKSYHYLPFGSGSRACPAKEYARVLMKILIVELVRNCTWRLLNQTPKIKYLPVPHPEDNLPVEFSNAPAHRRRALTL